MSLFAANRQKVSMPMWNRVNWIYLRFSVITFWSFESLLASVFLLNPASKFSSRLRSNFSLKLIDSLPPIVSPESNWDNNWPFWVKKIVVNLLSFVNRLLNTNSELFYKVFLLLVEIAKDIYICKCGLFLTFDLEVCLPFEIRQSKINSRWVAGPIGQMNH